MKKSTNKIRSNYQAGISLVEILVSITVGLLILVGVLQMFAISSLNSNTNEANSRVQENIRYALSALSSDISHAGNMGCISVGQDYAGVDEYDGTEYTQNLLSNTSGVYQWDSTIEGVEGGTSSAADSITIRYTRPTVKLLVTPSATADSLQVNTPTSTAYVELKQYQVVVASNCKKNYVFMISNVPDSSGIVSFSAGVNAPVTGQSNDQNKIDRAAMNTLPFVDTSSTSGTPLYLYGGLVSGSFRYYIGDSAGAASTCALDPSSCSLYRDNGESQEELVPGVSDLQIEYGQMVGNNLSYTTANSVAWEDIDRIKVTLMVNSVDKIMGSNGFSPVIERVSKVIHLANYVN